MALSRERGGLLFRLAAGIVTLPFLLAAAPYVAGAGTLEAVRARGNLVCGVSEGVAGFSEVGPGGTWSGLDIDFCGAVAAAVLGRKDAVKFKPLTAANRFQALKSGEVDLLSRTTAWTLSRDTELGLRFAGTLFYDGQGFMVRRGFAVASVLELSGTSVCVMSGTSAEQNLIDYFRTRQMRYQLIAADRWQDIAKSYADGACTLLSGDVSTLAYERHRLSNPSEHMILPELITKEPLGPVVRQGDEQWFSIVRWTLFALVAGEELGLTSQSIDAARQSPELDVRRFVGLEGNLGQGMGLDPEWSYQIVKQVGNYGEIFERNLGARSSLTLERGANALWSKGGLMYAPPLR